MRSRDEVLRQHGIGEKVATAYEENLADSILRVSAQLDAAIKERDEFRTEWDRAMGYWNKCADRIRELESQQAASEPVAEHVSDPYQFAAPFAWILVKNGKPQGIPVAHRPSDWLELERVWCAQFTPLYPQKKSVEVLERQWREACELGQAYCKRHGITDYGRSVFALLVEDAERLRSHPSAAGVTVTEAMVEAAWKELRVQCVPDGPSLVDCVDRDDLRSAITAALTRPTTPTRGRDE